MKKKKGLTKWLDKAKNAIDNALTFKQSKNVLLKQITTGSNSGDANKLTSRRADSTFLEDDDYKIESIADLSALRSGPSKRGARVSFSVQPPQDLLSGSPRVPSIVSARNAAIQSVGNQRQDQPSASQQDVSVPPKPPPPRRSIGSPRASPLLPWDVGKSARGSNLGQQRKRLNNTSFEGNDAAGVKDSAAVWVNEPLLDGCLEVKQLITNAAAMDVGFSGDLPTVSPQSLQTALGTSGMAVVVAKLNMFDADMEPMALEHQATTVDDAAPPPVRRNPSWSRAKLQRSNTGTSLRRSHTGIGSNQGSHCGVDVAGLDHGVQAPARLPRNRRASFVQLHNRSMSPGPDEQLPSLLPHNSSLLRQGPSKSVGEEESNTAQLFAMLAKTTRHLRAAGREPAAHSRPGCNVNDLWPSAKSSGGHEELDDEDVGDGLKLLNELLKAPTPGAVGPESTIKDAESRMFQRRSTMVDQSGRPGLAGNSIDIWKDEPTSSSWWREDRGSAGPPHSSTTRLAGLPANTQPRQTPVTAGTGSAVELQPFHSSFHPQSMGTLLGDMGLIWNNPTAHHDDDGPGDSHDGSAGTRYYNPMNIWGGQHARTSNSSIASRMPSRALSRALSKALPQSQSRPLSQTPSRKLSHVWSKAPSTLLASMTSSQAIFTIPPSSAGWAGYCNFESDHTQYTQGSEFLHAGNSNWFSAHSSPGRETGSADQFLEEEFMEVGSKADVDSLPPMARRAKSCAGSFSRSQAEVLCGIRQFEDTPTAAPAPTAASHQPAGVARDGHNPLWPVFYNAAAAALLKLTNVHACSAALMAHIYSNPGLMLVLEEMLDEAVCGRCHTYTHYVPAQALQLATGHASSNCRMSYAPNMDDLGAGLGPNRRSFTNDLPRLGSANGGSMTGWFQIQMSIVNLAISENQHEPGLFLLYRPAGLTATATASATAAPALSTMPSVLESVKETASPKPFGITKGPSGFLDFNDNRSSRTSRTRSAVIPRPIDAAVSTRLAANMQLMCMALAHVPCIITIITLDGRVVFQNGRSVEYCGLVANRPSQVSRPLGHPEHPLSRLYEQDMPSLLSMITAIQNGQWWSGLVRMPPRVDLTYTYPSPAQTVTTLLPAAAGNPVQGSQDQGEQPTADDARTTPTCAAVSVTAMNEQTGDVTAVSREPSQASVVHSSALYQSSLYQCSNDGLKQISHQVPDVPSSNSSHVKLGLIMQQALDVSLGFPSASLKMVQLEEAAGSSDACTKLKDDRSSLVLRVGTTGSLDDNPHPTATAGWFGSSTGNPKPEPDASLPSSVGVQDLSGLLGKRTSVDDKVPDLPMQFQRPGGPVFGRVPSGRCSMDSAMTSYSPLQPATSALQPADSESDTMARSSSMRFDKRVTGPAHRGSLDQSNAASSLWSKKVIASVSSGGDRRQSLDDFRRLETGDSSEAPPGTPNRTTTLIRSVSLVKRDRRAAHLSGAFLSAAQELSGTARAMKAFNARTYVTAGGDESSEQPLRKAEGSACSSVNESQASDDSRQPSKDLDAAQSMDSSRMEPCVRSRSRFALSTGHDVNLTSSLSLSPSDMLSNERITFMNQHSAASGQAHTPDTSNQALAEMAPNLAAPLGVQGHAAESVMQPERSPTHNKERMPADEDTFCWHDIEAHCLPGESPEQQLLVLVHHDVTHYVNAELEVKKVLDVEHKLLEEIFPRHVLEAMATQMTNPPVKVASGRMSPHNTTLLNSNTIDLDAADASNTPFKATRTAEPLDGLGTNSPGPSPPSKRPTTDGANASTPTKSGLKSAAKSAGQGLPSALARHHPAVTVLFADIKSFTSMCNSIHPQLVMTFLNELFTMFDELVEKHGVYKVETIGDCYMVCGGMLQKDKDGVNTVSTEVDPDHANKVLAFAQDMLRVAAGMLLPTDDDEPVELRVGIHSGPCMSGVVGWKMPRFCLFGDTINTASRMESTGVPGAIHVSESTWNCLGPSQQGDHRWRATGGVEAKGKGRMDTYMWTPS